MFQLNLSAEEVRKLRSRVESLESRANYWQVPPDSDQSVHISKDAKFARLGATLNDMNEYQLWSLMKSRLDAEINKGEASKEFYGFR